MNEIEMYRHGVVCYVEFLGEARYMCNMKAYERKNKIQCKKYKFYKMYFLISTLCHTDTMLFSKDVRDQYDLSVFGMMQECKTCH